MKKGKLIVIEGACDGIGKSTQYSLLKKKLTEEGYEVVSHHFPSYNTTQGKLVELYLSGELGDKNELSPYLINSLYAIDRAITWKKELEKEYNQGKIILLDRYTTSSVFYQSCQIDDIDERKKFIRYVCDYEYKKLGIKKPDQVIFLSAPFDLVTKLREERKENEGIEKDIHESDKEFMKKVYDNAMFVSEFLKWTQIDCCKDGKFASIEEIHQLICDKLKK